MKTTKTIKQGPDGRKWYVWTLEVSVSETWVEDGYEFPDDEAAKERIAQTLPFADEKDHGDAPVVFRSCESGGFWPSGYGPMVVGTDEQVSMENWEACGGGKNLTIMLLKPRGQDWTKLPLAYRPGR